MEENPKAFWSFVKKLRQEETGVADLKVDNKIVSDDLSKAEALSNQFASVFTIEDKNQVPTLGKSSIPDIPRLTIGNEGVLRQINRTKPNKAPGPDGISPWMLHLCADEISPVLTKIFQSSVDEGVLPTQWRDANICAIFKKGAKDDPANYRGVSLTSVVSKILEHIIHSHIMKHLEDHNILVDNQHGFRAKHSTVTQLVLTMHDLTKNIEGGKTTHMAILDFAKAFDKVPHERMLGKLEHYGIRGSLLKWLRHFLTARTQKVVCNGTSSKPKKVLSSVPQGTVLGPLMFLVFINDLPENLRSTARLFADDCVIYTGGNEPNDLDVLQKDLQQLEKWQNKWAMSFNAAKCSVMKISNKQDPPNRNYSFCGEPLKETSNHPYLGVEIDNKLRWDVHYKKLTSKANRVVGFLKRNLWFCAQTIKETAYKTLVRPILEYASSCWDPFRKGDIINIEAVQRRAARFCMNNYKQLSSVTKMIDELGWATLKDRRRDARLQLMHKIMKGDVGINADDYIQFMGENRTRGNSVRIKRDFVKKDVHKYSFFHRTAADWNKLDEDTATASTSETFKQRLQM